MSSGRFLQACFRKCPLTYLRKSANQGGISASTHQQMSSSRFERICKLGGGISVSAHQLMSSSRFKKICKLGGISANTHQMSSSRFENICKLGGGKFLQAHVSKCPVADLRKSANWGERNFCKHTSANVQ